MTHHFSTAFITGGLGFIGGHLASRLLKQGCEVTIYDARLHGEQSWHQQLLAHPRCHCVIADLRDRDVLKKSLTGQEIVYHLAANANSRQSLQENDVDLHYGIEPTWLLLQEMAVQNVKNIVYASTQLVYGEPEVPVLTEALGPLLPLSLYGASKLAGEGIISAHSHLNDMKATVLRFGNIIGQHMSYGIVLDFVAKLQKNSHSLEILGDGTQERHYLHVEDCVTAIITAAGRSQGKQCEVYNVGNTDCISAEEVANIVASVVLSDSGRPQHKFTGGRRGWRGDVPNLRCDIRKLRQLGWQPSCDSATAVAKAAQQTLKLLPHASGVAHG